VGRVSGCAKVTSYAPFLLLFVALLIALGFEFVNGFHDTANAVATVIYTRALPANFAVVWSGLFNLQFLDAPGGRLLIDFNPRAWNSLAVQVEAGANMPAAWVDLLLGRPVRRAVPRLGRQFRSEIDDARSLWAAWRGGQRSAAVRGLRPRLDTSHAIFSWTDPAPALHVLRRRGYH